MSAKGAGSPKWPRKKCRKAFLSRQTPISPRILFPSTAAATIQLPSFSHNPLYNLIPSTRYVFLSLYQLQFDNPPLSPHLSPLEPV